MDLVLASVSGYSGSERFNLIKLIDRSGASYVGNMTPTVTHLVCRKFDGKKYEFAKRFRIVIVNHCWIEECVKKGRHVSEDPFTFRRYAVVTGANKGIGLEICRQLASHGITVVLTARDENRGTQAVEKLNNGSGLSGNVIFHQLDVADSQSVASLAEFVKSRFGKLDILVNNAGIWGSVPNDIDETRASYKAGFTEGAEIKWNEILNQTNELTEACLQTNYYGAKRVIEALLPLLQLSDSPRIVNVSSLPQSARLKLCGLLGVVDRGATLRR